MLLRPSEPTLLVSPSYEALQLGPPALKRLTLRSMWPVRPLNQLAPVPDQPLKMPLRLLAGLAVQCVRIGCFGAHAEPYGSAGELLPQAQSSAAGRRSG